MDKLTLLQTVREQLAEGNTDQSLKLVRDFMKEKPEYKKLYNEALRLNAVFSKTKIDQSSRTISFENAEVGFGQVRKGLFDLLDFIENDDFNPASLDTPKQGSHLNKWLIIIGLSILLLAVAVLVLVNKIGGKSDLQTPPDTDKNACKVMFRDTTEKNFLIVPFYKPSGGEARPEGLVIDRLADFCSGIESFKNAEFEICDGYDASRTLTFEDGAKIGLENKATIVIWGQFDEKGEKTAIKTRYKYLGNKDIDGKIPFTQMNHGPNFKAEGEQVVVTDNVLSIIASSGELTQDLENTLKLLVGMIAQLDGNVDAAISALQSAQLEDSTANLMKYMMLADNFIAKNEPQKAKVALDTCLEWNNNYWLGRNNRANLQMESGEYLAAIEDLNVVLTKRPDDADVLLSRAIAFKKSEQLYAAEKDFEKVIKLKPEKEPAVREALKTTKIEINRLEKIVAPTKTNIETKQVSKQDLVRAASASSKLGNTSLTKQLIKKGLEKDRNSPELIAIQVDNLLKENNLRQAKIVMEEAMERGVKPEIIARQSKNVALFIKKMSATKALEPQ